MTHDTIFCYLKFHFKISINVTKSMSFLRLNCQKHPEPFFALARELYPGQFKVWNTHCMLINIFIKLEIHQIKRDWFLFYLLFVLFSQQFVTTLWSCWRIKDSWGDATHRYEKDRCTLNCFLEYIGINMFLINQNIDTLERVAGLQGDDLIEAHGTFYTSHCVSFCCRKEYTLDWMKGIFL